MANVLNLTLKKDIFEKLINGETNEIPIKKSDWWKKRLMDLDTGRFKYFDVASISSGSEQKYEYEIDHLEQRDEAFVVVVVLPINDDAVEETDSDFSYSEPEDVPEQINPEIIEPEVVNGVNVDLTVNSDGTVEHTNTSPLTEEQKQAIIKKFTEQIKKNIVAEQEKPDIKVRVMEYLNEFCNNKDVFVVNMPNVTIRNNGQIIGYRGSRRLIADRDSDVRIDFKKMYIMKYHNVPDDAFLEEIKKSLNDMLSGCYLFINKKYCGFDTSETGELIFKIAVAPKKKYMFLNR